MAGLKYNADKQMGLFAPFGKPVAPDCGPMPQVIKSFFKKFRREVFWDALKEGQQRKRCANPQRTEQ